MYPAAQLTAHSLIISRALDRLSSSSRGAVTPIHPTRSALLLHVNRTADSNGSPPRGPHANCGPAASLTAAHQPAGPLRRCRRVPQPHPHHFISSPLLCCSAPRLACKRHQKRQRPPPLEQLPLGASTPLKRRAESRREDQAMASNGDGKGRVTAAAAGGGYGYGYGGYEGPDDRKWWPWLVPTIIVSCIAVFVVEMYENNCPKQGSAHGGCVAGFLRRFSFQPLHENPLLGPSSSTLKKMGALDWDKIVHHHQGWRLISCIWLHAGLIHLIVNMLSLLFIGIRLEQQFGFVRIGAIYLVSGFGGSVLSALFLRNYISVGASGALFGLLGSMLSELLMNWTIYSNKAAAILTLLFIIAINLAIGILPHVDNFSHIGGFAMGFLLGFLLLARPQFGWMERHELPQTSQPPKYKAYQYVLWVVAFVLLLVGFVISLVMLFKGKNGYDSCHWCRYLNCVPTSRWKCNT